MVSIFPNRAWAHIWFCRNNKRAKQTFISVTMRMCCLWRTKWKDPGFKFECKNRRRLPWWRHGFANNDIERTVRNLRPSFASSFCMTPGRNTHKGRNRQNTHFQNTGTEAKCLKPELIFLWQRSCSLNIWSSISVSLLDSALAPSVLSLTFPPAASRPLRPPRLQEAADQTWSRICIAILSNYWHFSAWQFWRWEQEERSSPAKLAAFKGRWAVYYFPHGLLKEAHPSLADSICLSVTSLAWYKIIFFSKVKSVNAMDSSSRWVAASQSCEACHSSNLRVCVCDRVCFNTNKYTLKKGEKEHENKNQEYVRKTKAQTCCCWLVGDPGSGFPSELNDGAWWKVWRGKPQ